MNDYREDWSWKFQTPYGRATVHSKFHPCGILLPGVDKETEKWYFTVPIMLASMDVLMRLIPFFPFAAVNHINSVEMWWGEIITGIVWGNALVREYPYSAANRAWKFIWSDPTRYYHDRLYYRELPERFIMWTNLASNTFFIWILSWWLVMTDDVTVYAAQWSTHSWVFDCQPLWWYLFFGIYMCPFLCPYMYLELYDDEFQSAMIERTYGSEEMALEWYWWVHDTSEDSISRQVPLVKPDGSIGNWMDVDTKTYYSDTLFDYFDYVDQASFISEDSWESERERQRYETEKIIDLASRGLDPNNMKYWIPSKAVLQRRKAKREKRQAEQLAYRAKYGTFLKELKKRKFPTFLGEQIQEYIDMWLVLRSRSIRWCKYIVKLIGIEAEKIRARWNYFIKDVDPLVVLIYVIIILAIPFLAYAMYTILADTIYMHNTMYKWRREHLRWQVLKELVAGYGYFTWEGKRPDSAIPYDYYAKLLGKGKTLTDFNFNDY